MQMISHTQIQFDDGFLSHSFLKFDSFKIIGLTHLYWLIGWAAAAVEFYIGVFPPQVG